MKVLIVEDELVLAEFLRKSLRMSGHHVEYVVDGEAALEHITSTVYDVVILDIIIPKIDGLEVCRQVREQGIKTPIIIVSSQDREGDRVKGLDAGADDYMVKPFSYPELEARLRALHRRPQDLADEALTHGDIKLSTSQHKVWVSGAEVVMRLKEFALLEYLLRNRGRVVSREEIYEQIWGVQAENSSNRVDVCVKSLRDKVGKDVIITSHGYGYVIEAPGHS